MDRQISMHLHVYDISRYEYVISRYYGHTYHRLEGWVNTLDIIDTITWWAYTMETVMPRGSLNNIYFDHDVMFDVITRT